MQHKIADGPPGIEALPNLVTFQRGFTRFEFLRTRSAITPSLGLPRRARP
jgi:hypothetical protein